MPEATTCVICSKSMSVPGYRKHIFSSTHSQDIINAIHKRKRTYQTWLESFARSPAGTSYPKLFLNDKDADACLFCPVCKSLRQLRHNASLSCGHKKEMSEFIKECLAKEPTVPVVEEPEAPKVSDADLAALKKQVNRLQAQNESLKEMNAEASDDADALYTLLTHFHETDTDIFYQLMTQLKSSHSSVHERQLKNFEDET